MTEQKFPPSAEDRARKAQEIIKVYRARYAKLKATQDMPAPWEAIPSLPCNDIGWRMGGGEDFMFTWFEWIGGLSEVQFADYCRRHRPVAPRDPPTTENGEWVFRDQATAQANAHFMIQSWSEWLDWVVANKRGNCSTISWDEYWDRKMQEIKARYAKT